MADKRYPDVVPAFDRLRQEMARMEGAKQDCLQEVRGARPRAAEQAGRAREVIADLQPIVQKWVDAGMPKGDKQAADAAVLYVEASLQLRDALAGSARAEQVLGSKAAQSVVGA